ncbi:MAG: YqgE/AlgH family protein [Actinomycetia bacterium]|nr:YqgE/AlgH family protein [Actinomycetes bacterium]
MDESSAPDAWVEQTLTGRLLVASPELGDPHFSRTIVLLVDHDESGALGVVLNRPSTTDVSEILPDWHLYAAPPQVVFQGGPVGRDSALALAARTAGHGEDDEPLGFRHVHAGIGLVDLDASAELIAGEIASMRVFAGYAGWGSDQLEAEIDQGSWFVVDAELGDLSCDEPERLWEKVLRRQPPRLAVVATFPEDPSLN